MPFPNQVPRPYTRQDILSLNAGQRGCYGLIAADGSCIYVGCGDIRDRLLAHLNGDNPKITFSRPTHWIGVVHTDPEGEERKLIAELRPRCNMRLG